MKYYKAREIAENPKLIFDLIARTDDEHEALTLDPLDNVFAEDALPTYNFGICLWQLDGAGGLEARAQAEVDAAEVISDAATAETDIAAKLAELIDLKKLIDTYAGLGRDTTALEADFAALKLELEALEAG